MKILFGFISVLLVGAIIFFFTTKDSSDNPKEMTVIEKLNQQKDSKPHQNYDNEGSQNLDKTSEVPEKPYVSKKTQSQNTREARLENDDPILEPSDEEIYEDMDDTPEYSEEVSSEDFKEFIGIAIEELDSGDELAEAIITEMIKIGNAQPDHIDQVKDFYRTCTQKTELSNENRDLCLKFLEKLNENNN